MEEDLLADSVPINVISSQVAFDKFVAHIPLRCETSIVWWSPASKRVWICPLVGRWRLSALIPRTEDPKRISEWWSFMDLKSKVWWEEWHGELPEL
jgi:hypothetical protein